MKCKYAPTESLRTTDVPNLQDMRTRGSVGLLSSCAFSLLYQPMTAGRGWTSSRACHCEVRHTLGEMMLLSGNLR